MSLCKLTLAPLSDTAARAVSDLLGDLAEPAAAAVALFETDPHSWAVEAIYEDAPDLDVIAAALAGIASTISLALALELEPVPDENWVALSQAGLAPVTAGRFIIHGAHDRHRAGGRRFGIEIDAGEAFGTAHHATTLGCLLEADRLTRRRSFRCVLDLGCGSAVLAIAVAKALPAARIVASDIDRQAVAVAARNVRINGTWRQTTLINAAGLADPRLRARAGFDLIFANILAVPLITLAPSIARAARTGGMLVLSGLLTRQARQVSAAYVAAGFAAIHHKRLGEWSTLTFKRRR